MTALKTIVIAIGFLGSMTAYAASQDVVDLNTQIQAQLTKLQTTQQQQLDTLNSQIQAQIKQVQTDLQTQIQKLQTQINDIQAQGGPAKK